MKGRIKGAVRGQASLEAMIAFAAIAMLVALLSQPVAKMSGKGLGAREEIVGSATALKCAALLNETHSSNSVFSGQEEECVVENNLVKGKGSTHKGMEIIGNARMAESEGGQRIEIEAAEHYG